MYVCRTVKSSACILPLYWGGGGGEGFMRQVVY